MSIKVILSASPPSSLPLSTDELTGFFLGSSFYIHPSERTNEPQVAPLLALKSKPTSERLREQGGFALASRNKCAVHSREFAVGDRRRRLGLPRRMKHLISITFAAAAEVE